MGLCARFCRKKSADRLANTAYNPQLLALVFKHNDKTLKPKLVARATEVECSSNICSLQMLPTNAPSAVIPAFATFLIRASPQLPARNLNRKYSQANAPQTFSRARLSLKITQMQKCACKIDVAVYACVFCLLQ